MNIRIKKFLWFGGNTVLYAVTSTVWYREKEYRGAAVIPRDTARH